LFTIGFVLERAEMLAGNIRKLCAGAIIAAASCYVHADVPIDKITVLNLPPATPYRLYLSDMAISHFVDSKLMIIDGESLNVIGHVALGMTGHVTLTPDRSELLVSTAYMTKLNRGERIGQMDVYDATTLKLKAEISVPPKHSQSMPYRGKIRTSADGRLVMMQNSTPASSVTVVDRIAGKFVAEIATPGCWMIYVPQSVSDRFSTLCGDGTMLTVKLDAEGKPLERKKSAKFFDADDDALFTSGAQLDDSYTFVSFKGNVQTVNVAGDTAVAEAPWPLVTAAEAKAGWRPGGYQPVALHDKSGRIFVGMHPKGKEGSHKAPAKEIWAFDPASKKRIARVPGHHATVIAASRGDAPRVFAYSTDKSSLAVFDASGKLKHLKTAAPFGELATQLDVQ
jgi:methylamine dehydrogenase heavy chain